MRKPHQASILLIGIVAILTIDSKGQYLFPENIISLRRDDSFASDNREIIWSEDFASGLPDNWLNTEVTGIASWEYRGINTNPNNEIGSRGSCQIQGVPGQQILSPSWQNGFMIFDSNFWDNDSLPCSEANFGTGDAPGPHLATLTTSTIDLSTYGNVALKFHHYLNRFTGNARVEITSDGNNWYSIYTAPENPNPTTPIDSVVIQISSYAAFQPTVQFRFIFEGLYYYWQIDDIQIIETNINDIAISSCDYGAFNLTDPSHPTGFEYLPYSMYPTQMPPLLKFTAQATNMGSALALGCALQADLTDADNNNIIYSGISSELTDLPSGIQSEVRAGMFQVDTINRNYRITYTLFSPNPDDNLTDNSDTLEFYVNPYIYARDRQSAQQVYMGNLYTQQNSYDVANAYLMTADYTCHSILAAPATGTLAGATMRARIYELGEDNINASVLMAESSPVTITTGMINAYGGNLMTTLSFANAIQLDSGKVYLATVGSEQGSGSFVCALSGNSPTGSSFVRATQGSDDIWFSLSRTPMVRLNAEAPVVSVGESLADPFRIYPNPAADKVYLSLDHAISPNAHYIIKNLNSEVVAAGNMRVKNMTLECGNFTPGIYTIIIIDDKVISVKKFMVHH